MEVNMDWIALLGTVLPILVGGGVWTAVVFHRQNKRIKEAEAVNAELRNKLDAVELKDKERQFQDNQLDDLHELVGKLNTHMAELVEQNIAKDAIIKEKDAIIDDKTKRIREVEDSKAQTERENTRLAEENGELKADMAHHRCVIRKCGGRTPANEETCTALKTGTAVFPTEPSVDINADSPATDDIKLTNIESHG